MPELHPLLPSLLIQKFLPDREVPKTGNGSEGE